MLTASHSERAGLRLKDMSREELQNLVEGWGEKRFHGRQLFSALLKRGVVSSAEITDLPLGLRRKLSEFEPFDLLQGVQTQTASDGTVKVLLELNDGLRIESVWMPEQNHAVQCLSTQVGCPLECTFCATGLMGFKRNLSSGEIIDQVIFFRRQKPELPLRNLVFMGMGEPLLNYSNLVRAIRVLSAEDGPAISQRRMTVSSAGVVPGIRRLAQEGLKVKLAISLNAPTDDLRDRIMPINRKYPLPELMKAAAYFNKKMGNRITFEYTLMPAFNDTPDMIEKLKSLLIKIPCKLNLIPLNSVNKAKPPTANWDAIFDRFYHVFAQERITLTMRRSRGVEIQAACGQLATDYERGLRSSKK